MCSQSFAQHAEACLQEDVKRLRVIADRAAGLTKDRVAARDALALGRQLAQLDATPEQVPQPKVPFILLPSACNVLTPATAVPLSDTMSHATPAKDEGHCK